MLAAALLVDTDLTGAPAPSIDPFVGSDYGPLLMHQTLAPTATILPSGSLQSEVAPLQEFLFLASEPAPMGALGGGVPCLSDPDMDLVGSGQLDGICMKMPSGDPFLPSSQ